MEFTPEQNTAYQKAAIMCSRSEKCAFEIREKLLLWDLSPENAEPVLDKLKEEKYIDDERFARAYVKDKFRFNNWGKQKITHMLRAKKIPSDILELAFEEIEDETYREKLMKLLSDKVRSIKSTDIYDKRNKLMRFALGRGFETGKIYEALKELET